MQAMFEGLSSLKQIVQSIEQVVWVLDLSTDSILYVSPAFEAVWGRSSESLYADPLTLIKSVHPEDRVKVMSASPDDSRKSLDLSYRILRPDGSQRWISAHTFLIRDDTTAADFQVCVAQDITDQNMVDQTLRKALDRSREQFTLSRRMSLARKPEAVLKTLMSASELRMAKRAVLLFFESSLGIPPREIEVIASWLSAEHLKSSSPEEASSETHLFEELALLDLFHPSKPVVIKDVLRDQRLTAAASSQLNNWQTHSIAIFPLAASGHWLGCLLVFFPEEKQFEPVELRQIKVLVDQASITLFNLQLLEVEAESRHEAERANEIKTRFLAMISHELRTPLTSIKGFTTTLLADDVDWEPEEQRDFIQTIEQETNRLQELIDHLLDLSRLEAGMLPITLAAHSLGEIVRDALPQFQIMTQAHQFSLRLPTNLPLVFVDAKRIAQVLVNLVHNSAMYSPSGTEIVLSANVRDKFVQVSVSDQGPGIPKADHKHVFQSFWQGRQVESGAGKGAGLGLAICKGLVEAHGGQIWIKKHAPPGTTISFTIPIVHANDGVRLPRKV